MAMRFLKLSQGRGLGRNLSIAVGLAIMLCSGLLTVASIVTSYRQSLETHRQNSLIKTSLMAPALGGAVRFGKVDALEEALAGFAETQPEVFGSAAVFNAEGEVVTQIGDTSPADALLEQARDTGAARALDRQTVAPLTFGPDAAIVGYLMIEWSDEPTNAAMRSKMVLLTAVGLVLAALAWVAAYLVIGRLVAKPVERIAEAVRQVAQGDLSVEVPLSGRGDEIGALARDIEELRQQLLEAAEQRSQQDERDKAAEAAKAAMLRDLETGVGEIVRGARDGVFDNHVNAVFDDPTMQSLADNVNALCDTIADYLDELGRTSQAMSAGNFNRAMPDRFGGRLGDVAVELNATLTQISQMVAEIAETERAMVTAISAMRRDAEDLSVRSERQASSLEQTSAAMEELTASTGTTTDNVGASATQAEETRRSVENGRGIVQNAIAAVDEIKEESDRISAIISVIEGIAFQTNLLALNAAVEAARAGDAGKGFAVVASEVRTLAQRAAEAAGDITQLIVNSQNKVLVGAKLVNESGTVLETISGSIAEISERLKTIAGSTREQSIGISSMSQEIAQLDEVTQNSAQIAVRNASGAEALDHHARTLSNLLSRLAADDAGTTSEADRLSA